MTNFSSLAKNNALQLHGKQLPNVVKDAMELVRLLGERYLWVDSLCIVQDDAKRTQLSYDSDILNAFAGVEHALANCCHWTFTNGMPENILDFALLWIPLTGISRRGPNLSSNSSEIRYPSWAWAGWVGTVRHNINLFCNADSVSQIMSAIDEFWIQTPETVRRVERKEQLDDSELGSLIFPTSKSSPKNAPGVQQHWSFLPAHPDILCFKSSVVPASCFSIPSETKHAYRMADDYAVEWQHPITNFFDGDGTHCGSLYGAIIENSWTSLRDCEFVLISTVRVVDWDRDDPEWYAAFDKERYKCTEPCTLNVMLVRRRGEFVERQAVGQIHIDAWMQAGPEEKLIYLV
ncbi:hypothetical protein BKA63DRAFT_601182 [Paraphoma chrysanthemicola]|nr:hypothetical protein BKA63DRAFT_601182 [Paraphoma chrysanthemicola]